MDLHFFLIFGHIIGAVLGVGGATMIEMHLNKALRDGKMDETERGFLGGDFLVTRIGMGLCFVTGIGFIIEYWAFNQLFRLSDGVFWAKMLIFLIIIINAYLLHKHKIGLYWGSAFSFVSWWIAFTFGIFLTEGVKFIPQDPLMSFFTLMAIYGTIVVVGARVLHIIRERVKMTVPSETSTPQT
jgi:hypothetical protein